MKALTEVGVFFMEENMELTEIINKIKNIFGIQEVKELGDALLNTVISNDIQKYESYVEEIGSLDNDNLQPIFQYYMADRKEKCQDFTPKSLGALLSGLLCGRDDVVYDMCAGCGSLTIQMWNKNKNIKVICRELDENAIPFLLFNLAVRNISGEVYRGDVLKCEDYEKYILHIGEKFSFVERGSV